MGFTEEQLLGFGSELGLTETEFTTFTQCVTDGTYLAWAANTNQEFLAGQIGGTPSGYLNGEAVETKILADRIGLAELVASKS
jgi:hypothetical protein